MPTLFSIQPELIFSLASGLAFVSWVALAASPYGVRWAARVRFVAGRIVPLIFAVAYVALFAAKGMGDGGFDSIAAVQRLCAVPELLTAGWLHYLAFDLFGSQGRGYGCDLDLAVGDVRHGVDRQTQKFAGAKQSQDHG